MELVASARLRRARRDWKTRPYYNTVYRNIQQVLSHVKDMNHPANKGMGIGPYVVISTDNLVDLIQYK